MNQEKSLYGATRVVWYLFYIIETLLVLRFTLKLLAANPNVVFTDLVYQLSAIFVTPFMYVFGSPSAVEGSVIEFSTLLAIFIYWLLAWGIVKLIVMNRPIDTDEARSELERQDRA